MNRRRPTLGGLAPGAALLLSLVVLVAGVVVAAGAVIALKSIGQKDADLVTV